MSKKTQPDLFDAVPTDRVIWEADGTQWTQHDHDQAVALGWLRSQDQLAAVRKLVAAEQASRRYGR